MQPPPLSKETRDVLAQRGRAKKFARGETIFMRGDPGDIMMVIEEGLIEVSLTSISGRKSVIAHLGAGEVLGEMSVLDAAPRSADAVALKTTKTVIITRAELLAFMAESPPVMMEIIETLCQRVRHAAAIVETLALNSASARLARCLLLLTQKWGTEQDGVVRINQKFSQSELGTFAGVARENVNRCIRTWCLDGVISVNSGIIDVLDMPALEDLCDPEMT